jgi:hypothetical protein
MYSQEVVSLEAQDGLYFQPNNHPQVPNCQILLCILLDPHPEMTMNKKLFVFSSTEIAHSKPPDANGGNDGVIAWRV